MSIALPEVRLASRDAVEKALAALDRRLGPSKVDTSDAGRQAHARDDSAAVGRVPDAVVRAEGRDDVAAALDAFEAAVLRVAAAVETRTG